MKTYSLLLALLSIHFVQAQHTKSTYTPVQYKNSYCRADYTRSVFEGPNNAATLQLLMQHRLPNLQDKRCSLILSSRTESLAGIHYLYIQLFNGIPVYQGNVKVNTDKKNTIRSVLDNTENTGQWNVATDTAGPQAVIAIHPKTKQPVVANILQVGYEELLVAGNEVIFRRDMNTYFSAPDSLVYGKVFRPDPLTAIGRTYDTTTVYQDANDADATWLNSVLEAVPFRAFFDNTKFTLKNEYVEIREFDDPVVQPVTSTVPEFSFTRSESGFEDVMAFYHLTNYQNYVASLGFNCADSLVIVDTHANDGQDNSFFTPGRRPQELHFGTGGVDDAEDADVIVHEYGHFLSYHAAPGSNNGGERISLDEAFGDYLAASYSRTYSTFKQERVFNWDGHNEFWNGRVVNSQRVYPDLSGNIYIDAGIWSAVLFSLNQDISKGVTDSLIIETHYSYAGQMSMMDAAEMLLDADNLLFNGSYACAIYKRLEEHGLAIIPANCKTLAITDEENLHIRFTQNGNSFTILNSEPLSYSIQVFNMPGQKVAEQKEISAPRLYYQNTSLATGAYLVNISIGNTTRIYKWIKAE